MSQDIEHDEEDQEGWAPRPVVPRGPAGRSSVPVRQHLLRHSLESSALAAAGLVVTADLLAHSAVPLWSLPVIGMTLTGIMFITSLTSTGSMAVAGYLTAWGVAATGWITATRFWGLWNADMITAILLVFIVLGPTGAVAIGHHRREVEREHDAREGDRGGAHLRRWEQLFDRHGIPGVTVLDVIEHRRPGDGTVHARQVHGRLGRADGARRAVTFDQLRAIAPQIAVSKRLDDDGVTFTRPKGGSSADFIMHVKERSGGRPRQDIVLPAEMNVMTITRPLPLGVLDSGRIFELLYREIVVLVIGVRGSGKSNLVNVFIAQLAKCIDALIFMIDLKGGRAARPWMMPWIEHNADRPVIDWLATTRPEAKLMMDALMAAGQARARSGKGFDKIEPDRDTPAIILVVDETAVMTGHGIREDNLSNYALATDLARLAETFRSEAIDPLVAALRGNVDILGSTALKAQTEVRIGLRVTASSEGDSVFPDDHQAALALSRVRDKGDGIAKVGPDLSPTIHFYKITEELIRATALFAGPLRPVPEDKLVLAMGEAYEQRWNREHGQMLLREWREQAGVPEPPDVDDAWGAFVAAHQDDPEKPPDPRRARMRELLRDRGVMGYTVQRIVTLLANEGMTTPRETIQRWLADDERNGLVRRGGAPTHRWRWAPGLDAGLDNDI